MNTAPSSSARSAWILGLCLAIGFTGAAAIMGNAVKNMGAGKQIITVKGLAEKPVKADRAEWHLGVAIVGDTFANTLNKVESQIPALSDYLKKQGFNDANITIGEPSIEPRMIEVIEGEHSRMVQQGFNGQISLVVQSTELNKITQANRGILALQAAGQPVVNSSPLYLVSDLENVKMSLIGAATENAQKRAEEFAKHGAVKVGAMRNAAQGAFYILAPNSTDQSSDYGGTYDKTTIDKIARVVVTIDYSIEK
jgi:uncharacterized protein